MEKDLDSNTYSPTAMSDSPMEKDLDSNTNTPTAMSDSPMEKDLDSNTKTPTDMSDSPIAKRKKSCVCDHFSLVSHSGDGKFEYWKCNYCEKDFKYASSRAFNALLRHLDKCVSYPYNNQDKKQELLPSSLVQDNCFRFSCNRKLDQKACQEALAKMFIIDGLPFEFVELEEFRNFRKIIQPQFDLVSRPRLIKDCVEIYELERKKLEKVFEEKVQRVCLATEIWTSTSSFEYLSITAHYIDTDWRLNKKIINFCLLPFPCTGEIIAEAIELVLMNWGLKQICTLTVNASSVNDVATQSLRKRLAGRNWLLVDGEFFHVRCITEAVNLIARDAIDEVNEAVFKIRNSVIYIRSCAQRRQLFNRCISPSRGTLRLDVPACWDSTFFMLENALKFQDAFERFEEEDVNFPKEVHPTKSDWENAGVLCKFLKKIYDAANRLLRSPDATANDYLVEACEIERLLFSLSKENEPCLRDMSIKAKEKFDKYWGSIDDINILLMIAVVLDPRYKLLYLEFHYSRIHESGKGAEMIQKVKDALDQLFKVYHDQYSSDDSTNAENVPRNEEDARYADFKRFLQAEKGKELKTEVEQYLEESLEYCPAEPFDILRWWSTATKYQVLSRLARDVLAIPLSSVSSELAFSTRGRVLNEFQSSLTPPLLNCMICAQSWLRSSPYPIEDEEDLIELEDIESATNDNTGFMATDFMPF